MTEPGEPTDGAPQSRGRIAFRLLMAAIALAAGIAAVVVAIQLVRTVL
ncbi:MAG: hypothetical protein ACJ780_22095 [Solirubrobacteraceae bacterium]